MTQHYRYRLDIQRVQDGVCFPGDVLPENILQTFRDQAIFLGQRRGVVGPDAGEAITEEEPLIAPDMNGQITGVRIHAGTNGKRVHKEYDLDLFAHYAREQAVRLARQGHLAKDAKFIFRVFAQPTNPATTPIPLPGVTITVQRFALPFVAGKLADWMPHALAVGSVNDDDYPLFITKKALDQAREYCRKPKDKEAGALLLGRMFKQSEPESELFGVIEAAIEAKYAEQQQFSLDLTAQTFAYIQAQLHRRRTRLGFINEVPLGFAHSHNFLPAILDDGSAQCPTCPKRPTCELTSSFYSAKDVEFHQALFSRAPFAVGLVWGLTPREEDDLRVFCLDGGGTRQRGFFQVNC